MTGISEENSSYRPAAQPVIHGPTLINRASRLTITIENPGSPGTLWVFDQSGQMTKNLGSRSGNAPVTWPLVDKSGKRVPAGIYFILYENGKATATHKVVVAD